MENNFKIQQDPKPPEKPVYLDEINFKTPAFNFEADGYSQTTLPQAGIYNFKTPSIECYDPSVPASIKELIKNVTDGEINWSQKVKTRNDDEYTKFDLIKLCKDITSKAIITLSDEAGRKIDFDRLFSFFENKEKGKKIIYEGQEVENIKDVELINNIHSDDLDIPILKSLKELSQDGRTFTDSEKGNKITLYEIYKRIEKNDNNLKINIRSNYKDNINDTSDLLSYCYLHCKKTKPIISNLPENRRGLLKSLVLKKEWGMYFSGGISEYGAYQALSSFSQEKLFLINFRDDIKREVSNIASFYGLLANQIKPTKELLLNGYGLKDAKLDGTELPQKAADFILEIAKKPSSRATAENLVNLFKNCVKLAEYLPNEVIKKTDGKKLEKQILDYFKFLTLLDKRKQDELLSLSPTYLSNGRSLSNLTELQLNEHLKGLYKNSAFAKAFDIAGATIGGLGSVVAGITLYLKLGLLGGALGNSTIGASSILLPTFLHCLQDRQSISDTDGWGYSILTGAAGFFCGPMANSVSWAIGGHEVGNIVGFEIYKLLNRKKADL